MRRAIFGIVLLIFLTACAPKEEPGVVGACLRQAVAFDFDDTIDTVPPCIIDLLGTKKVVLLGEIHYVKEHDEFLSRLMEALHREGFRYFLQEVGTAEGAVIDAYIKGKPVEVHEEIFAYDEIMITRLAKFNAALRAEGKEEQQITYAGIDINHMDTYEDAVRALCGLYCDASFSPADSVEEILERAQARLTQEERDLLAHLADSQEKSMQLRMNWCNNRREDFMEEQVDYAVKNAEADAKILVNTGLFHAQLCPEWTLDAAPDFRWLAMRLKESMSAEEVYTIGVNAVEGTFRKTWNRNEHTEYAADTDENRDDLIARLQRRYPGQSIFMDFHALDEPHEPVLVQNPLKETEIPLREQFDGMIIYPHATPIQNPRDP